MCSKLGSGVYVRSRHLPGEAPLEAGDPVAAQRTGKCRRARTILTVLPALQIGQLFQIFSKLGTPDELCWKGVTQLPDWQAHFPKWAPRDLQEVRSSSPWPA